MRSRPIVLALGVARRLGFRLALRLGLGLGVGLALCLALCLPFLPGCSEEDGTESPCAPPVPGGRIEGEVRLGDKASGVTITATRVPERPGDVFVLDRSTEADGTFGFDVPAGRYIVSCFSYGYAEDGLREGAASGETLVVEPLTSPVRVRFDLATLSVALAVPPFLDGETAAIRLDRETDPNPDGNASSYVRKASMQVAGGQANIVLRGVLPGRYRLRVELGLRVYSCIGCVHAGEFVWYPSVRAPAEAEWLDFPPDGRLDLSMDLSAQASRMTGTVGGAWREMQTGPPDIRVFDLDGHLLLGPRTIEDDGTAAIDMLYHGPVKVLIEHNGIGAWVGGMGFDEALEIPLEPGTTATFDHEESGILVETESSEYLWSFEPLRVFRADGTEVGLLHTHMAPVPFPIAIPNLGPGEYRIRIEGEMGSDPWIPQWFDGALRTEDATTIPVSRAGETVRRTIHLIRGATISGTIGTDTGPDYRRYTVFLTSADDPAILAYDWSATATGRFEMIGVPDGSWKLGIRATEDDGGDYAGGDAGGAPHTIWFPGTSDWAASQPIVIADLEDVTADFLVSGRRPR
ncbi:MAG: hypothetical protein QUU85_19505 [Candidatus Eisenbacteria bacterium]|nr:hypothetical protein [Candidatus Eisenbacteria bacterium]